jgi:hypothetical protein
LLTSDFEFYVKKFIYAYSPPPLGLPEILTDSISDLKAPGPDGLPSVFYKNFWDVVGEKLTHEVRHMLNGGQIPERWNETTIALIPKVEKPEKVTDLCPNSHRPL